jgi:hypothetical protein
MRSDQEFDEMKMRRIETNQFNQRQNEFNQRNGFDLIPPIPTY